MNSKFFLNKISKYQLVSYSRARAHTTCTHTARMHTNIHIQTHRCATMPKKNKRCGQSARAWGSAAAAIKAKVERQKEKEKEKEATVLATSVAATDNISDHSGDDGNERTAPGTIPASVFCVFFYIAYALLLCCAVLCVCARAQRHGTSVLSHNSRRSSGPEN